MSAFKPAPDPGIYLLADHLDAALAAGEDLLAETLPAEADRVSVDASADMLPAFVTRLARFEAALIARVLQARRRASELPRLEPHMRPVLQLLVSQSESLLAIIDQFGDTAEQRFLTGDDPLAFLRSRGVLGDEAAALPRFETLKVTDRYKLAGTVEMGPLLDMISGALEALDIAYDLFPADDDDVETPGVVRTAGATVDAGPPPADAQIEAQESGEADIDADAADAEAEAGTDADRIADGAVADKDTAVTPSSLAQALASLQRAERAH